MKRPQDDPYKLSLKILNDQNRRVMTDYGEYMKRTAENLDKLYNEVYAARQQLQELKDLYDQVFQHAAAITPTGYFNQQP